MTLQLSRLKLVAMPFRFIIFGLGSMVLAHAADLRDKYTWQPLKIRGGGFVTGLSIHPRNAQIMYCYTDVGGAYKWDPEKENWKQLIVGTAFDPGFLAGDEHDEGVKRTSLYNVEAIAIDPEDENVVYLAAGASSESDNGFILKSHDGGSSFTAGNIRLPMGGNEEYRSISVRLAVDPNDSNIVYFGSRSRGLYRSMNGGLDWTQVSIDAVPTGTIASGTGASAQNAGINNVMFDPQATIAHRSVVYAAASGQGIYRSDDGGEKWSNLSGMAHGPSTGALVSTLQCSGGSLFVATSAGLSSAKGGVYAYNASSGWTDISPYEGDFSHLAVDPADPQRLALVTSGMAKLMRSLDGGKNWTTLTRHISAPDAKWRNFYSGNGWISDGPLLFAPGNPNRVWFAEGFGMMKSDNLMDPQASDIQWTVASDGIEEVVSTGIAAAGGNVVVSCEDLNGFWHSTQKPDDAPDQMIATNKFSFGTDVTYCFSKPDFFAVATTDVRWANGTAILRPNYSGTSSDGGRTWTLFPSISSETGKNTPENLRFGVMAISATDPRNMVWVSGEPLHENNQNRGNLTYFTSDQGQTWKLCSGITAPAINLQNYLAATKPLTADGADGGHFYLYQFQDGGVLKSSDKGETWSRTSSLPGYLWHSQLRAEPGVSGNLWFCSGFDCRSTDEETKGLWHSTDKGDHFTRQPGVTQCVAIGFGAAAKGAANPTVYMYGKADDRWGVFRSTDEGQSWDLLSEYPQGLFARVNCISGDMSLFGRVYLGFSGNGFVYGKSTDEEAVLATGGIAP